MSEPFLFGDPDPSAGSPTDPASVLAAIAADCRSLDAVGKLIGEKSKELADAEIDFGDAYDAALAEADGGSKDKREAQARHAVDAQLRGRVTRLRREIEAYKKWADIKGKTLSGRQSQLSTLRDEQRGLQGPQPAWTPRAAA